MEAVLCVKIYAVNFHSLLDRARATNCTLIWSKLPVDQKVSSPLLFLTPSTPSPFTSLVPPTIMVLLSLSVLADYFLSFLLSFFRLCLLFFFTLFCYSSWGAERIICRFQWKNSPTTREPALDIFRSYFFCLESFAFILPRIPHVLPVFLSSYTY